MLDVWKTQFSKQHFFLEHKDPIIFITSQWQQSKKPDLLYLIYRWVISLFFVISWIMSIIDIPHLDQSPAAQAKWLIYLTNWGYTLCIIQSCFGTGMLSVYFLTADKGDSGPTAENDNRALKMYKIYWATNIIATDLAFGITVLYWTLIYNAKEMPLDAMNIIVHGLNSFLMLLDVCIVAFPTRILHFYMPVVFGTFYVIFSIIYFYAGGTNKKDDVYIYPILNWTDPGKSVLVCLGVTIFLMLLHVFTYGMYRLRKTIYEKSRAGQKGEATKVQSNYKDCVNNPV